MASVFNCQFCGVTFPLQNSLATHIQFYHNILPTAVVPIRPAGPAAPVKRKTFTCDICAKNLSRMDKLKEHRKRKHKQEDGSAKRHRAAEEVIIIDDAPVGSHGTVQKEKPWRPWEETQIDTPQISTPEVDIEEDDDSGVTVRLGVLCPICEELVRSPLSLHIETFHAEEPETSGFNRGVAQPVSPEPPQQPYPDELAYQSVLATDPQNIDDAILEELQSVYGSEPDVLDLIKKRWNVVRTKLVHREKFLAVRQVRMTVHNDHLGVFLRDALEEICREQGNQFKIDLGFTTVNEAKEPEETEEPLKVRYAADNSRLFEAMQGGPVLISSLSDVERIHDLFDSQGVLDFVAGLREDSSHQVKYVVGVTFFITDVTDQPLLGCPGLQLPLPLVNSKSIRSFIKDAHGRPYTDRLCALRCLASFKIQQERKTTQTVGTGRERYRLINAKVEELWLAYCQRAKVAINRTFPGIKLTSLHLLEDVCEVNINVYRVTVEGRPLAVAEDTDEETGDEDADEWGISGAAVEGSDEEDGTDDMDEMVREWEDRSGQLAGAEFLENNRELLEPLDSSDESDIEEEHQFVDEPQAEAEAPVEPPVKLVYQLIHRSLDRYKVKANLIQYQDHLMLATNLNRLFGSFKCDQCDRLFDLHATYKRHVKSNCTGRAQTVKFAKGGFRPKKNIFKRLEELGYDVPEADRYYPYRSTWDYECITLKEEAIPQQFEPLARLEEPELPLPNFMSLTEPQDFVDLRRQYDYRSELWTFFIGNKSTLLTQYRLSGKQTIRFPYGSLPADSSVEQTLTVVKNFTHQLMARQKITYTLKSVVLLFADMIDPDYISLLKKNILPKSVRINTAGDALDALGTLRLVDLPPSSRLISVLYTIDQHRHLWLEPIIPISWSVTSNVNRVDSSGHDMSTPRFCVVPADTPDEHMGREVKKLIITFYNYLNEIADAAYELMSEKFAWLLAELTPKAQRFADAKKLLPLLHSKMAGSKPLEGDETLDDVLEKIKEVKLTMALTRDHATICGEFLNYLRVFPAVAFNSARFDINLIRNELFSHALRVKDCPKAIKKGRAYISVTFRKFIFLDCVQFMGAGISLAGFLKAWGIKEEKGCWPYDTFQKISQLNDPLPDIRQFDCHRLKEIRMSDEQYEAIKNMWAEQNWTTMLDMLSWYNNGDVSTFLLGLNEMCKFWIDFNIDPLKSGFVSLPGVSMALMFSERFCDKETIFHNWNKRTEPFFRLIKSEMVGGASLIFSRYQEAQKTRIRSGHMAQVCCGIDGTSMYLSALCSEMPTGIPNHFRCLTEQLHEDVDDCPHEDQLQPDLEVDPFEWIEHERGSDGYFYGDMDELIEADPYLSESIEKWRAAPARKDREQREAEYFTLEDQRKKLTELREFWLSQKFSHEKVFKFSDKEIPAVMTMRLELEEQHKMPEGTLEIQHQWNGGQKRILLPSGSEVPVDAFFHQINTVGQFHGCHWHSHWASSIVIDDKGVASGGCWYVRQELNRLKDKPEEQQVLLQQMKRREAHTAEVTAGLRQLGYTVVETWECEFDRVLKFGRRTNETKMLLQHCQPLRPSQKFFTGWELLDKVKDGSFFGLMEVDIRLPEFETERRRDTADFPGIFRNTLIGRDDLCPRMRSYAERNDILLKPRRSLISSFYGEKILLSTPLLRYYLSNGYWVTRIYQGMQYYPQPVFKGFGDAIQDIRRCGDLNPSLSSKANMAKLLGNAGFGKTITCVEKHLNIRYLTLQQAKRSVMSPLYQRAEKLDPNTYEVTSLKKTITHSLPCIIGFFVFNYGKLRLLEMEKFIRTYVGLGRYALAETDTDSLYFSLGGTTKPIPQLKDITHCSELLELFVPPEKLDSFKEMAPKYLCSMLKTDPSFRELGLFKIEWMGAGILSSNSKLYITWKNETDESGGQRRVKDKVVHKGVSIHQNPGISVDDYENAIMRQTVTTGQNRGMAMRNGRLHYYQVDKAAVTCFYGKRLTKDDNVSTLPLTR